MLAVINDQSEAIKTLVSLGADLAQEDRYGYTALDKAETRGLQNIVDFLSDNIQADEKIFVNPITHMLESYEVYSKNNSLDLAQKYQVNRFFNGEIYPYYKNTPGMLIYMFGNFDNKEIEKTCIEFDWFNSRDDKSASDQELFSFGDMMAQNMGMQE